MLLNQVAHIQPQSTANGDKKKPDPTPSKSKDPTEGGTPALVSDEVQHAASAESAPPPAPKRVQLAQQRIMLDDIMKV